MKRGGGCQQDLSKLGQILGLQCILLDLLEADDKKMTNVTRCKYIYHDMFPGEAAIITSDENGLVFLLNVSSGLCCTGQRNCIYNLILILMYQYIGRGTLWLFTALVVILLFKVGLNSTAPWHLHRYALPAN